MLLGAFCRKDAFFLSNPFLYTDIRLKSVEFNFCHSLSTHQVAKMSDIKYFG